MADFDAVSSATTDASDTNTSLTYSHTTSTLADRGMLTSVALEHIDDAVSGITYAGVAMTLDVRQTSGGSFSAAELWRLASPATGANNVVVSIAGNGDTFGSGTITATATSSFGTAVSAGTASGTSLSATVAGVVTGDFVVDGLCVDSADIAITEGADQTERWHQFVEPNNYTGNGSSQLGSAGGVMSDSWTGARPGALVANAFKDVAAAAAEMEILQAVYRGQP